MMRAKLYGLGLMTLIKQEETVNISGEDAAADLDIAGKTPKIYVLLMKHLDKEHIAVVNSELGPEKEGNGVAVWDLFRKKYAGSKAHHQMISLGEFINIEFKETQDFVKNICNRISKIRTTGLDVKEQVLALLILKKLPKEFESLVRIIITDNSNLKIEEVIGKIERDHIKFKVKKLENVEMVGQGQRRTIKCYNCGLEGHSAKIC
ncbi:uncharacterized protein VP01_5048g1 [Puccinia sorghi]|uniref:CCHC-type domain-containing protein n=1 Tax=Puccinia sorghi TaxID=27349 RepID=A0A0L6UNK4_9BASI|nr:uncharacterized protein VP01_5048g1 [Puccinia sorghi]